MQNSLRGNRKQKKGVVVSNKMQKTLIVRVDQKIQHPRYHKIVVRSKKFYADCGDKKFEIGDQVTIREARPLSKLKRWTVVEEVK